MNLSNQTKFLLLVAAVVAVVYFLNSRNTEPIHNEGALDTTGVIREDSVKPESDTLRQLEDSAEQKRVTRKALSKNSNTSEEYKQMNYAGGKRGNGPSDFDNYFDVNNDLVSGSQRDNDEFLPNDESEGKLAGYKGGERREITDEEIFRAEDYLPQEQTQDWFEVMPEQISSKNRHLISVTRPVGVNTVGTSLKNASYDIRGCPVNPKFVISPKFSGRYVIIIIF